jgi:hypothetical protein
VTSQVRRGIIDQTLTCTGEMTIEGIATADVRVRRGARLVLTGICTAGIRVDEGATLVVDGIARGIIVNHGRVAVSGIVAHEVAGDDGWLIVHDGARLAGRTQRGRETYQPHHGPEALT